MRAPFGKPFAAAVAGAPLAIALLLLFQAPALAVITGGCTGSATATGSGGVDLTTASVWHLKSTDSVSGSGTSPTEQTFVNVGIYAFGFAIPVYSSTGKGHGGSAGPFQVSAWSKYARVLAASGASDSCSGAIELIVDDISPVSNAAGAGGAAVGVAGVLGILGAAARGGGAIGRVGGGFAGLIAGTGLGLLAQQAGAINPESLSGLAVPGVGLVAGAALAGAFRR